MATYKIIQDIESEDHILGPLSFRQFVFALIAAFMIYLCFIAVAKHAPFLLIIFGPPALFFGFFALPFGRDQPTEIWALAKIRFLFKPRRRVWDQSGMKELVTITVPKKIEHIYTDGLSQNEVKSRLNALANTLDSRGWAVKNLVTDSAPATVMSSDRLVDFNIGPLEVPSIEIKAADDILNETATNPIAQQFESMIDESTQARRQALLEKMDSIRHQSSVAASPESLPQTTPTQTNNTPWFTTPMVENSQPSFQAAPLSGSVPTADEQAIVNDLRAQNAVSQASYANMQTLQPDTGQAATPIADPLQYASPTVTATPDPAILNLANNNDLYVSTIARQANKVRGGSTDEVVVSLH